MREILFRGRRIDNGQWAEGAFLNDRDGAFYICPAVTDITYGDNGNRRRIGCWFKVDPATVGQYTGLADKNGKRIFEGDVVRFKWDAECEYCHIIEFNDGEFCATPVLPLDGVWQIRISGENKKFAVIGNIHDNPELLEEIDNGID